MKLANPEWVNTLQWDICHPGELCLEDPDEYRFVVSDLTAQEMGEEGKLILSENGEELCFAKEGLLIRDLWSVDVNRKKLLSGVLKQITSIAQDDYYAETAELTGRIGELLEQLTQDAFLPLEWDMPADLMPVLKAFGVRLESSEDPLERLIDYIRLCREYLKSKVLILIGVRGFMTVEECNMLCRDLTAAEIPVLFVEPYCRPMLKNSVRLLIDVDHCELPGS